MRYESKNQKLSRMNEMAGSKKDVGRPSISPMVLVLKPKLAASLDEWIAAQPDEIPRKKAIRKLLKYAIKKKMRTKARIAVD